jgi:hypothetical protein
MRSVGPARPPRIIPASISGRRISGEASLTPLWNSAAYL